MKLFCGTILTFIFCFSAIIIYSQVKLPVPKNIERTYADSTRSETGEPGIKYWQNTADYEIDVSFDPTDRMVNGTVKIHYFNNSADTLRRLLFKLYPNLYKKGAARAMNFNPEDIFAGVEIDTISISGKPTDLKSLRINGTNMTIPALKIFPNSKTVIEIGFNYQLNKTSHIRTGEIDSGAYFIAYFFPRIAVYDDIDGWNDFPYNGSQEFYNDFCNFKVSITVPPSYFVWATGDLINAENVLPANILQKLKTAENSDSIVDILEEKDSKNLLVNSENRHWKFEANNVTDFVFALSDHYLWKSTSVLVDSTTGRRTRVDAVFNPNHQDYYNVIDYAKATVYYMSYAFPKWPFPYSHITVFDGLDQMEYPMMVNDNPVENETDEITLTDHEIMHTMFPFFMGINETKYAWMDEGWATIGEWLISSMIDTNIVDDYGVVPYENTAGMEEDLPIITLSTQLNGASYFLNAYAKPAFGYLYVKDFLGNELFTKALHHYINNWKGKHPMPFDFFYSMNEGSGKNLNWFWKRWFFDNGVPDLAIHKVKAKRKKYFVEIISIGNKPVPVDLTVYYYDGTTEKYHQTIGVWENSDKTILAFQNTKRIQKLVLDGTYNVDADKSNNVYKMKK